MTYEEILEKGPFTVSKQEKNYLFCEGLRELTAFHKEHCPEYKNMMSAISFEENSAKDTADFPFLPVRLFKELSLKSVEDKEVFKVMTSSGTSGQQVSRIYLDRGTAANQQKTLAKIVSAFTGAERLPMLVIDCPSVVKNREVFSARGAGILGFSIFGRKSLYALNDDMELQYDKVREYLTEHRDKKVLVFGFTFMIWQHFYKALKAMGRKLDLSNAVMIHGGGWKKLVQEAVSPPQFNEGIRSVCGIPQVVNYYGMVEQTGCIYMECEYGHLHASTYSDVIVRRTRDFSVADDGEKGIVQVISLLPRSYPGHSLLTEDEGVILGEDDCPCGRRGKYFRILGRLSQAELRGCSDTYAEKF